MHRVLKKNQNRQTHEFAFFCRELPATLALGTTYRIGDQDIIHRMVHVVRVESGDTVILFGRQVTATVVIDSIAKNGIICTVLAVGHIKALVPAVTWYLPLLDREAFEESVSVLTSMGASAITPVITQKSDSRLRSFERLGRVMVAAAEQSKQFALPTINPVVPLVESGIYADTGAERVKTIFFDPDGAPAFEVMGSIRAAGGQLACLVGPEGDLTEDEKRLLREHGVIFCALTPTILRAEQAVTVAMGLVRSCGMPGA